MQKISRARQHVTLYCAQAQVPVKKTREKWREEARTIAIPRTVIEKKPIKKLRGEEERKEAVEERYSGEWKM